jgi:Zn-dependent protease with chaperone function
VAITLAQLLAQMLAMMVSRQREFLADDRRRLTRNPTGSLTR